MTEAPTFWAERYDDLNAWERHLDRNGTKVVKLFLHVSKAEQKKRFMARLDNPDKLWKFNAADVTERALWDEYMAAYEDAITATSTEWAPWYVVPADHKHVMQALTVAILVDTIESLDLRYPTVSDKDRERNAEARTRPRRGAVMTPRRAPRREPSVDPQEGDADEDEDDADAERKGGDAEGDDRGEQRRPEERRRHDGVPAGIVLVELGVGEAVAGFEAVAFDRVRLLVRREAGRRPDRRRSGRRRRRR